MCQVDERYTQYITHSLNRHTELHRYTYTQISNTHTWQWFTLLVSRDSWRFVIIPRVSEASKLHSPGLSVLFPAVSLSEDQSPVTYAGIPLNCSACYETGSVYQLSANTLNKTPCCTCKYTLSWLCTAWTLINIVICCIPLIPHSPTLYLRTCTSVS